jgi:hypothetical protein
MVLLRSDLPVEQVAGTVGWDAVRVRRRLASISLSPLAFDLFVGIVILLRWVPLLIRPKPNRLGGVDLRIGPAGFGAGTADTDILNEAIEEGQEGCV